MCLPGPVAQSVASPIANQEVRSSIQALPHIFVEIDHPISSMVILLPLIQEGYRQLQAKVYMYDLSYG